MRHFSKGFTLIELLVVIGIIMLLATLSVFSLDRAREKSRDAKRLSDIRQIQTALERYYADHRAYPGYNGNLGPNRESGQSMCLTEDAFEFGEVCNTQSKVIYMIFVPGDPGQQTYQYISEGDDDNAYQIVFRLEGATAGLPGESALCATNTSFGACSGNSSTK